MDLARGAQLLQHALHQRILLTHWGDVMNRLCHCVIPRQPPDKPSRQINRRQTATSGGDIALLVQRLLQHLNSCLNNPGTSRQISARGDTVQQTKLGQQQRAGEQGQDVGQPPAASRIQIREGFIQGQASRLAGEHSGQAGPLAFSQGQPDRITVGKVFESHLLQRPLDPGLHFPGVESEVERAEGDVSADGGAEELIFGHDKVSSGASSDIQYATSLARNMVTKWGMSDKLGPLQYEESQEGYLGMGGSNRTMASDETNKLIDSEIRALIDNAHVRANQILTEKSDQLELLAQAMLEYETLSGDEIKELMDKGSIDRPSDPRGPSSVRPVTGSSIPKSGKRFSGGTQPQGA